MSGPNGLLTAGAATGECPAPPISGEELCDKIDAIIDALGEIDINFVGDVAPTKWCTLDGEPIYICKKTDVATGDSVYEYQIIPEGSSVGVPYDGERECCEVDTGKIPADACFDGCLKGQVFLDGVTLEPCGFSYKDADGVLQSGVEAPAIDWCYGSCDLRRECVTVWTLNSAGTFFECSAGSYTAEIGEDGQIKKWFLGLTEIADPTAGLALNTDYTLLPCDMAAFGEIDTEQTVVVPFDVNTLPDVTGNELDGVAVIESVCTLEIKACLDCENLDAAVVVEYVDCVGNPFTETIPAGCTRTYHCLGSDVTVTGQAVIYAAVSTSVPIEEQEC